MKKTRVKTRWIKDVEERSKERIFFHLIIVFSFMMKYGPKFELSTKSCYGAWSFSAPSAGTE